MNVGKRAHNPAAVGPFQEPEIRKRRHVFMYASHVAPSPPGQLPHRHLARTQQEMHQRPSPHCQMTEQRLRRLEIPSLTLILALFRCPAGCAQRGPPVRLYGNNQCALFQLSTSATKSSIKRSMPANSNSQSEEIELRATRWQPTRHSAIGVGSALDPVDLSEVSTTLRAISSGKADFGSKPHESHIENFYSHEHRENNGY